MMKKFVLAIVLVALTLNGCAYVNNNYYLSKMVVESTTNGVVTLVDAQGEAWELEGDAVDLLTGQVTCLMDTCGTATIYDDIIIYTVAQETGLGVNTAPVYKEV